MWKWECGIPLTPSEILIHIIFQYSLWGVGPKGRKPTGAKPLCYLVNTNSAILRARRSRTTHLPLSAAVLLPAMKNSHFSQRAHFAAIVLRRPPAPLPLHLGIMLHSSW